MSFYSESLRQVVGCPIGNHDSLDQRNGCRPIAGGLALRDRTQAPS
jgi:hypothetical protein